MFEELAKDKATSIAIIDTTIALGIIAFGLYYMDLMLLIIGACFLTTAMGLCIAIGMEIL